MTDRREGRLGGRLIGLGVTGSIAAYKAVELLRLLRAEGADVAVMLTPAATRFVGPLSFAALSRHPVETELLDLLPDGRIGHIVVGDSADAIVVAPATAHWLGAMANGLAGDVVTGTCLATSARVVVAPAMDGDMGAPGDDRQRGCLREFGYAIVEPEPGPLVGPSGRSPGRAETIVDAVVTAVGVARSAADPSARPPIVSPGRDADLAGRHIVVTSATRGDRPSPLHRQPFDREDGRRSRGSLDRGARVTIIAANVEAGAARGGGYESSRRPSRRGTASSDAAPDGSAGFDA